MDKRYEKKSNSYAGSISGSDDAVHDVVQSGGQYRNSDGGNQHNTEYGNCS